MPAAQKPDTPGGPFAAVADASLAAAAAEAQTALDNGWVEGTRDPDFQPAGTVRYELHKAVDGERCCIKRVEIVAICETRDEARAWMLGHRSEWDRLDAATGQGRR